MMDDVVIQPDDGYMGAADDQPAEEVKTDEDVNDG